MIIKPKYIEKLNNSVITMKHSETFNHEGKTDNFMRHYTLLDFICLSNTGIVHVQKNCILSEELYSIYTKA